MTCTGRALVAAAVAGLCAPFLAELALSARDDGMRDAGFPAGLFIADAARGVALAPGFAGEVQRVHRFRVSVNEHGYRDRPWSGDRRPSILTVGSSALFGFGVETDARLSERLEHHLGDRYRVLNAGVYSYGPPQARATIEKECRELAPRLVLYFHEYKMTRRDFLEERRRHADAGEEGKVQADIGFVTLPRLRAWLLRRGWHPRQVWESMVGRGRLSVAYLSRYAVTAPSVEFPVDGPRRAAQAVAGMAAAARRCNAQFAMVLLPGPYEHRYADEPASATLLLELKGAVPVVDLRRVGAERPTLLLEGTDYFDPPALDAFARELAREIVRL